MLKMSDEPDITINGVQLTSAQSMAVRVAISSFDADCGDDFESKMMAKAYGDRLKEVFRIMMVPIKTPRSAKT